MEEKQFQKILRIIEVPSDKDKRKILEQCIQGKKYDKMVFFSFDIDEVEAKRNKLSYIVVNLPFNEFVYKNSEEYKVLCRVAIEWLSYYLFTHFKNLDTTYIIIEFPVRLTKDYQLLTGKELVINCDILPHP